MGLFFIVYDGSFREFLDLFHFVWSLRIVIARFTFLEVLRER